MGWPNWRRKGEGGKEKGNRIPLPPLPFLLRIGIGKGGGPIGRTPSRIPPTWGAPLAASPPLQPIYIYVGEAPLEHTLLQKYGRPCLPPGHIGAGAPPHMGWPNWRKKWEEGKEKGNRIPPSPSSLPTPNRNRKGGSNWTRPPSRIPHTWGAPLASPSPSHLYI